MLETIAMKDNSIKKPNKSYGEKKLTSAEKNKFIKEISKEVNRNIALRAFKDLVIGR